MGVATKTIHKRRLSSLHGIRPAQTRRKLQQPSSSMDHCPSESMPTLSNFTVEVWPTHSFATQPLWITELQSLVSAPTAARLTGQSVTAGEPAGERRGTSA